MEWKDELPEDLRGTALVQEAKDIASVVKQAVDFQRMLGNSLRLPSENASEADVQAFREKVQKHGLVPRDKFTEFVRPADPSAYSLPSPPPDAEKIGLTQTQVDLWKAQAHELGLSPEQFAQFADKQIEQAREAHQARMSKFEAANEALKAEWGEALNERKQLALQAAQKFGGEELVNALGENPDPSVIKALAEIGKQFAERGVGDLTPRPVFTETRDEAAVKLAEIQNNPQHPYNLGHLRVGKQAYDVAMKEVVRLRALSMGLKPPSDDIMFDQTG